MLVPSYKPLEITLIKRDKNKMDLRNELKISSSTVAKIAKGEYIHLRIIGQLCEYLNCKIEDVVEFVEVEK